MVEPLIGFLSAHTRPDTIDFFIDTTTQLWAGSANPIAPPREKRPPDMLRPSSSSELTRAFEIGSLLYLPFW